MNKLKPATLENIPALLDWIKKYDLSIHQVKQVYFLSAEIEEELINEIVKAKIWTHVQTI